MYYTWLEETAAYNSKTVKECCGMWIYGQGFVIDHVILQSPFTFTGVELSVKTEERANAHVRRC